MVFQPNPVDFNIWHNPSQAFTEKHVSYPRLTATVKLQCTCSAAQCSLQTHSNTWSVSAAETVNTLLTHFIQCALCQYTVVTLTIWVRNTSDSSVHFRNCRYTAHTLPIHCTIHTVYLQCTLKTACSPCTVRHCSITAVLDNFTLLKLPLLIHGATY